MFEPFSLIAYLAGQKEETHQSMKMSIIAPSKTASPSIQWRHVPPEANSLALVVRDERRDYYWVVYNLPSDAKGLPLGADKILMTRCDGVNSFGDRHYDSPWAMGKNPQQVTVQLYALDRRFTAKQPISGEVLMTRMKPSVIAKTEVVYSG